MFTITSETWTSKTSLHSDPIHSKNVDEEILKNIVYINMCAEIEDGQNQNHLVVQNGYRTNITDEELWDRKYLLPDELQISPPRKVKLITQSF